MPLLSLEVFITCGHQRQVCTHWQGVGRSLHSDARYLPSLSSLVPVVLLSVLFLSPAPCTLFHIPVLFHMVFCHMHFSVSFLCLASFVHYQVVRLLPFGKAFLQHYDV